MENSNRVIKFRAWDKIKKTMLAEFTVEHFTQENYLPDNLATDLEWMQFTGLLDKNGKEIYEGDIVKYKDLFDEEGNIGYIYWEAPTYVMRDKIRDEKIPIYKGGEGHIRQWSDGTNDWCSIENIESIEIIGNIYENKELI